MKNAKCFAACQARNIFSNGNIDYDIDSFIDPEKVSRPTSTIISHLTISSM